jgi:hypothetical protein
MYWGGKRGVIGRGPGKIKDLRSFWYVGSACCLGKRHEIDVPIRVNGRHWGGFKTAYKL